MVSHVPNGEGETQTVGDGKYKMWFLTRKKLLRSSVDWHFQYLQLRRKEWKFSKFGPSLKSGSLFPNLWAMVHYRAIAIHQVGHGYKSKIKGRFLIW